MDLETPIESLTSIRSGRYQLSERLGSGGMATVYRAWDRDLGVERAIKVLRPEEADRASFQRRLRAEAHAMARVQHPHILTIHDVGTEGSYFYVVTPIADGGSLSARLDDEGALPVAQAVSLTLQVLDALAAAHAVGVIHRDVKPANVLLDHRGHALLADFGIALDNGVHAQRRTRAGSAMGSPAYMPPEQRVDARSVDVRADVYAAGATLYELLTAMNPADLYTASHASPRWDAVPAELVGVLQKATAMQRGERYRTVAAFAQALIDAAERSDWGAAMLAQMGEHSLHPATWASTGADETLGMGSDDRRAPVGTLARTGTQEVVSPLAVVSVVGGTGMFLAGVAAMAIALVVMVGRVPPAEVDDAATVAAAGLEASARSVRESAATSPSSAPDAPALAPIASSTDPKPEPAQEASAPPAEGTRSPVAARSVASASAPARLQPTRTQDAEDVPLPASEAAYSVAAPEASTSAPVKVETPPTVSTPPAAASEPSELVGGWTRSGSGGRERLEVSQGRGGLELALAADGVEQRYVGELASGSRSLSAVASGRKGDGSTLSLVLSPDGSRLQGTLRLSDGQTKLVSFSRL